MFTRSRPPSVSPNSLHYALQVGTIMASNRITKLTRWCPRCAFLCSLDYGLQVYLQTCSIVASMFAQSLAPSASPNLLDPGLQVHLRNTRKSTLGPNQSKPLMSSRLIKKKMNPASLRMNDRINTQRPRGNCSVLGSRLIVLTKEYRPKRSVCWCTWL